MSRSVTSTIVIAASCADVWQCLIDFSAYPSWNPFVRDIQGRPGLDETLKVSLRMVNSSKMRFRPKVVEFEPERRLVWLGHVVLPGLFDGRHEFEIVPNQDGTTAFRQSECFSGILSPLFRRGFDDKVRESFQNMNEALKARVEQRRVS